MPDELPDYVLDSNEDYIVAIPESRIQWLGSMADIAESTPVDLFFAYLLCQVWLRLNTHFA